MEDVAHLCILYNLALEVNLSDRLREEFVNLIKSTGQVILGKTGHDETLVGELIALKERLDRIIKTSFANNSEFMDAEKDAFESFMNCRQNRAADLIAKYADYQLRGGAATESATAAMIEPLLDSVIVMFRFIQGKDYFEGIFKRDLSRRLLFPRSVSIELEKSFVARLKQECGSAFTSRLEGMFKDIELSKRTMIEYHHGHEEKRQSKRHGRIEGIDFNVTSIASGLWPCTPLLEANIPQSVIKEQKSFTDFYQEHNRGRILTWHQGLGNCILKANFPLGVKELQLSIPQALTLLQFNDATEKTYGELRQATGLDDMNLVRALQSLACGKVNILVKNPKGREISVKDQFSYNSEFTSKHNRIRISAVSERDAAEEPIISPTEDHSDRQYQVDATIVRLLKNHKKLDKQQLMRLASEQLRFELSHEEFTRRSESLIDREYVGKDPEDSTIYIYLS